MVSESKYTSRPKMPLGSNVPAVLTTKVMPMPSATGRSMLTCRWRTSRNALVKKGPQAKKTTGSEITHEAQRSSVSISCDKSPGCATYAGHAYIITCIMQKPATSQRHSARRLSTSRWPRTNASMAGTARYPALRTAAIHCDGSTLPGCHTTRARRVAALTSACNTPGTDFKASSMVRAQAAQCIPSSTTCESQVELAGSATALASSAEPEGVQGRPKPSHSCGSSRRDTAAGSTAASEASTTGATGISGAPERNIDMVQAYPRNMTSLLTWIKPQKMMHPKLVTSL